MDNRYKFLTVRIAELAGNMESNFRTLSLSDSRDSSSSDDTSVDEEQSFKDGRDVLEGMNWVEQENIKFIETKLRSLETMGNGFLTKPLATDTNLSGWKQYISFNKTLNLVLPDGVIDGKTSLIELADKVLCTIKEQTKTIELIGVGSYFCYKYQFRVHPLMTAEQLKLVAGAGVHFGKVYYLNNKKKWTKIGDNEQLLTAFENKLEKLVILQLQTGGARQVAPTSWNSVKSMISTFPKPQRDSENNVIPLGFENLNQIKEKMGSIFSRADISVVFCGSSLAGYGWKSGKAFGSGSSDYDIALCNERLFKKAADLGLKVKDYYCTEPLKREHFSLLELSHLQSSVDVNYSQQKSFDVHYAICCSKERLSQRHTGPALHLVFPPDCPYTEQLGNWKYTSLNYQAKPGT